MIYDIVGALLRGVLNLTRLAHQALELADQLMLIVLRLP